MAKNYPNPQLNKQRLFYPEVGDYWHEMFTPVCKVVHVSRFHVTVFKTIKSVVKGNLNTTYWDETKIETMTKRQFRDWLSYDTIPDKTWADVVPRKTVDVECGNPNHPDGAWHPAEGLPGSWEWIKSLRQWWRVIKWGCSCPKRN